MSGYSSNTIIITSVLVAGAALLLLLIVGAVVAIIYGHLTGHPKVRLAGIIVLLPFVALLAFNLVAQFIAGPSVTQPAQPSSLRTSPDSSASTRAGVPIEYTTKTDCQTRRGVCRGILARDQDVESLPCRGQTEVVFAEADGRLERCTLASPVKLQSALWPAGTIVEPGGYVKDTVYRLPSGAEPVAIGGLRVHSGLAVHLSPKNVIRKIVRNAADPAADTRLEAGEIMLELRDSDAYLFGGDGAIVGGVLAQPAVLHGVSMKAGERVIVPAPPRPAPHAGK